MVLRRIDAIDRRPQTGRERRAVLQIAAHEFAQQLPDKRGKSGGAGRLRLGCRQSRPSRFLGDGAVSRSGGSASP